MNSDRTETRRWWRVALLVITVALALSGCALGGGGAQSQTLNLLTILPVTGADSAVGLAMRQAVDLAVHQNASLGGKYTLGVIHVDESLGDVSQLVSSSVAGGHVLGVVGPYSSDSALAVAPVIERAGIATITPGATLTGLTQASAATGEGVSFTQLRPQGAPVAFFQLPQTSDAEGKAAADLAVAGGWRHGLSAHAIFVVDDGTISGKALATAFSAELVAKHGSVAGRQSFTSDALDNPLTLVAAIVEAYPDAVFYAGNTLAGAQLRGALTLAGVPQLPLLTAGSAADNPNWSDAVGGASLAAYSTALLPAGDLSTLKGAQAFVSAYKAAYGGATPLPQSALAYDAAMDEIAAIRATLAAGKTPTASAVLSAIASGTYHGVTGDLAFDKNGANTNPIPFSVYTCDTKGVWTYQTSVTG